MKKTLILIGVAVISLLLANVLMIWGNPETNFWKEYLDRKSEILESRGSDAKPSIFVTGGSSCSFSIEPRAIEGETGMSCYNMGGSAAMGAPYLVANVLRYAKSGDVVVLAIEPALLRGDVSMSNTPLAIQLAIRDGDPLKAVGEPVIDGELHMVNLITTLRPGSMYTSSMLGKWALRKEMYRYSMGDWRDGGRLSTSFSSGFLNPVSEMKGSPLISNRGQSIILQTVVYCREKGIKICYALPWLYTQENATDANKAHNQQFLDDLSRIIDVLTEPSVGVCTKREQFADTTQHLTDEGADQRSREMGKALKEWLSS
jgi:hypothetical protein